MKRIRLFIAALLFPAFVFAGGGMREADKQFAAQQYWSAISAYQSVLGTKGISKTDVARAYFQIGECDRMLSDWKNAKNFYSKAINAKYPDDKEWLYLAQDEQMLGEYQQAIQDYTTYQTLVPSDPAAQIGIDACNEALKWLNEPNRWQINNVSELNSKTNDFCPTWSDRKHLSLVYSSKRPGQTGSNVDPISGGLYSDLFEATISKTGKWSTPSAISGSVNLPESNDGASCITKNGNHIFFTRCDQKKNEVITCKIYYSEKKGNTWDVPVVIDFGLDAATLDSFNFRHPAVSANEEVMVFSSDMSGTTGGVHSDLWISTFDKKTKTWSRPVNMGKQINTNDREGFPYISEDGSLYFSSDGHGGMGGLDIFKAPKSSATEWKWGTPENLKTPFNSPADDFGIVIDGKKKKGYLTSNRDGTKGMDDIWKFEYIPLCCPYFGIVKDTVNGGIPVRNALVVVNFQDGTQLSQRSGADGSYKFNIGEDETFIVSIKMDSLASSDKANKYFIINPEKQNAKYTSVGLTECQTNEKDFIAEPIRDIGIAFPAVLYDLDKATLLPQSKDSLDYLYRILIDNPTFVIELDAHTDCRGSADHNRDLAQRRAQSCVDYLISKGISKDRLVAKGFGEDRPLKLPDGTVLTEKYINSKPAKDREALHQLNRRTTFRILNTNYIDPKAPAVVPAAPVKVKKGYYDESGDEISDDGSDSDETPQTSVPK